MTPTPRTEEFCATPRGLGTGYYQALDFARQLERELAAAHLVLDNDPSKIIRNAKDGYPEGRPDRVLTLEERIQALCRYASDYKGWLEAKEQELSTIQAKHDELETELIAQAATSQGEMLQESQAREVRLLGMLNKAQNELSKLHTAMDEIRCLAALSSHRQIAHKAIAIAESALSPS